jgi:hypothetical protein
MTAEPVSDGMGTQIDADQSSWERDASGDALPIHYGKRLQNQQETYRYSDDRFYGEYTDVTDACFGSSNRDRWARDHIELTQAEWDEYWNASLSRATAVLKSLNPDERGWNRGKGGAVFASVVALAVVDTRSNEELFTDDTFSENFTNTFEEYDASLGEMKRELFTVRGEFQ